MQQVLWGRRMQLRLSAGYHSVLVFQPVRSSRHACNQSLAATQTVILEFWWGESQGAAVLLEAPLFERLTLPLHGPSGFRGAWHTALHGHRQALCRMWRGRKYADVGGMRRPSGEL